MGKTIKPDYEEFNFLEAVDEVEKPLRIFERIEFDSKDALDNINSAMRALNKLLDGVVHAKGTKE